MSNYRSNRSVAASAVGIGCLTLLFTIAIYLGIIAAVVFVVINVAKFVLGL